MTEHIKEAIELNEKRMPLYADLTNGKSLRFSRKLIAIEYLSLLVANYIDKKASFFQKYNVKIVATDFISMEKVVAFKSVFDDEIDFEKQFEKLDLSKIRKTLKLFINTNEFEKVVVLCDEMISQMSHQLHHYGMCRHLFESMRRIAYLAPLHEEQCEKQFIKSTIPLSKRLLQLHFTILQQAYKFDEEVAFIQNEGIPFIIQDMPRIELENPY